MEKQNAKRRIYWHPIYEMLFWETCRYGIRPAGISMLPVLVSSPIPLLNYHKRDFKLTGFCPSFSYYFSELFR
jgi:hypothetical protein